MSKPIIRIHNSETDEYLDREMNDSEYAQFLKDEKDFAELLKAKEKQELAKKQLLEKLGITEDEAKLLLS